MFKGDVIRTLLLKQGRKPSELCEKVFGNPRYSINSLTKEDANPTAKTIEALADYFNVPIDTFFDRSSNYVGKSQTESEDYVAALKKIIESQEEALGLLREKVALLNQQIEILNK